MITSVYACGKVTGGGQIIVGDGTASFGFNAMHFTKQGLKGEQNYVDHTTGNKVHAHTINYLGVWEPINPPNKPHPMRNADFYGPCTLNGVTGYRFYVWVQDDGEPKNPDMFSITVWQVVGAPEIPGDSTDDLEIFSAGGPLLHGNIQVHKPPK